MGTAIDAESSQSLESNIVPLAMHVVRAQTYQPLNAALLIIACALQLESNCANSTIAAKCSADKASGSL